jgi:ribosomal protein L11 methyltransferase
MPYLELSFELDELEPERAERACFDSGALSVTLSHGDAAAQAADTVLGAVLEPAPGEVRLWHRTRLKALFAAERAEVGLILALARELGCEPSRLQAQAVADRIWEREWLQDFHPMCFGQRLWICPRHESILATNSAARRAVVRLDPGLAFGTGTHPSTALCLEWLDGAPLAGCRIIDYGSGSGVLAIAALKLGASRAYAFDIDPQALQATRDNAAENDVLEQLEVCAQQELLPPDCEFLVANILSETLLALAPRFALLVARGGSALLAGILLEQEAEVAARYSTWFDMKRCAQRDPWVALQGRRQ